MALNVEQPDIPNGAIIHLQYDNDNNRWKFVGFLK